MEIIQKCLKLEERFSLRFDISKLFRYFQAVHPTGISFCQDASDAADLNRLFQRELAVILRESETPDVLAERCIDLLCDQLPAIRTEPLRRVFEESILPILRMANEVS